MANIEVTAKGAKEYGDLARKAHPKLNAAICVGRSAWSYHDRNMVETTIWCSICVKHYTSPKKFFKEHGGE